MPGRLIAIAVKSKPFAPVETLEVAEVTEDGGLRGDFRGASPDRQVTLVFEADWLAACADLGQPLPWTLRRANLLVAGLANPRRAGDIVRIGDVVLAITGETHPCGRMDKQANGLRAALEPDWRGGLTARVTRGGVVRSGDQTTIETS